MEDKDFILVVDDEYSNRLLLEELLFEYHVESASGGNEMWRAMDAKTPQLILMDVMMPEEDGFSLAEKISKDPRYKHVPIIFVTAKITGKDVEKGFDLGGYDYIKKPFNQLELETRVRKTLEKTKIEKGLLRKSITADKILNLMYDGVVTLDAKGLIISTNSAFEKLTQKPKAELEGRNIESLLQGEGFMYCIATSGEKPVETSLLSPDGTAIPAAMSNSPIIGDAGEIIGWVCVVHDISMHKLTEQKLIDAKDKAEQADRLKSVFLANMSHEIRTPMNSIVGFSELLEDEELNNEERAEYISIIQKNSDKLLNFIDNLLDISTIEAGQIQINPNNCLINPILDELLASFTIIKNKMGKQAVKLELEKAVADEDFYIITDNYRFQQILMNLIANALKFTKEGKIIFGYERFRAQDGEHKLRFFVKDSGVGIPTDKQDVIFDRFGRIDNEGIENNSGSGLGLAISKNLAELLGGGLHLDSELGKGTMFWFDLPMQIEARK
jgi:PAS domain S-box-containing protein